jgi:predicted nucleic acid-binding protein
MATDVFIDTNILLYAASSAPHEAGKAEIARKLLVEMRFGSSIQVIQEFYVNATGKLARHIPGEKVAEVLALLKIQPVVPLTWDLFEAAWKIRTRYQISYWDAAIVAAAKEIGAAIVYSEDLAHGQVYDGVRVVNPFV